VIGSYDRLEREQAKPRKVVDYSARWARLEPVASANGTVGDRVAAFCKRKRISLAALGALGARVTVRAGGAVCLAFAGENGNGIVTAIKYRPVGGSSHDTTAEQPSTWLRPIVVGNLASLDWFVAEGETDTARLWELVGDAAAILCLPTGARTFRREWAALIPRGATVHLAHDADEDGDEGAEKATRIIGGRVVRVRPPVDGGDWCDWDGDRDEFVALVAAARAGVDRDYEFRPMSGFLAHVYPAAEPLLGSRGELFLGVGSLFLVYGAEGTGKSTLTIDAIAHLAAGSDWLEIPVPRPVRVLVIENEGPPSLFQQKLSEKAETWDGPDWTGNVFVYQSPWGEFTFANGDARTALTDFCDEHAIDVVTANPTLGLGVAASGRPDETQRFVDWLTECGLKTTRAFWLLHHENKAGQISGDWGRHPDTKVQLQADGNRPRTKLVWEKTRWATLPTDERPKALMLEWIIDAKGYRVVELDTAGASDIELEARLEAFLADNPLAATRHVHDAVQGRNDRLSELLKTSSKFDCVDGPRGAKLWFLATTSSQTCAEAGKQ
jgi:hypothetical protein